MGTAGHVGFDKDWRVKLLMTEADANALQNTLSVLEPYSGGGLTELREAVTDALRLLRE